MEGQFIRFDKKDGVPGEWYLPINDYNKEEEIKNLKQKMKNSIDYNEKLELAKKIAILNGRGE